MIATEVRGLVASKNQIPVPKNRDWHSKNIKRCVFMFRVSIIADPICHYTLDINEKAAIFRCL